MMNNGECRTTVNKAKGLKGQLDCVTSKRFERSFPALWWIWGQMLAPQVFRSLFILFLLLQTSLSEQLLLRFCAETRDEAENSRAGFPPLHRTIQTWTDLPGSSWGNVCSYHLTCCKLISPAFDWAALRGTALWLPAAGNAGLHKGVSELGGWWDCLRLYDLFPPPTPPLPALWSLFVHLLLNKGALHKHRGVAATSLTFVEDSVCRLVARQWLLAQVLVWLSQTLHLCEAGIEGHSRVAGVLGHVQVRSPS